MTEKAENRAIVFVDANNWYHGLENVAVRQTGSLDYVKISQKLLVDRSWIALRWYVGQVKQDQTKKSKRLYADQRRFLDRLKRQNRRISVHLGRLEKRSEENEAAHELLKYLATMKSQIPHEVYWGLYDIGHRHRSTSFFTEKAVDVMLAVDLVSMAIHDEFDTAYLLSADGDYTHAVGLVQERGKKVIPVAAGHGTELKKACGNVMVKVDQQWLDDCYLDR